MKFVIGKMSGGEIQVGSDVKLTDMQEIEVADDDPLAPHKFVGVELCTRCGRPQEATRHHIQEI